MSYILDALKRSEQEEKIRQTPALDTVHNFSPKNTTSPAVIILLLMALILATAAVFYLYSQNVQRNELTSSGNIGSQNIGSGNTGSRNIGSESMGPGYAEKSAPKTQTKIFEKVVTVEPVVTATNIEEQVNAAPVQIRDLPYSIQQEIPEMRFSSHIFAEDPTLRLVNINGVNIREGSHVTKEIRLLEITEEGVLLRYQNYTFEMSVLRDWTFD